jgi:hemerythrin
MICVQWTPAFNIGINDIDMQHKWLVSIMNKLCDAVNKKKGGKVISDIIKEMWNYANVHFDLEEKYFDEFHYEKADEHKAMHREFSKKVQSLARDFEEGKESVPMDAISFLGEWFINHTQTADREYVPLFHAHGF